MVGRLTAAETSSDLFLSHRPSILVVTYQLDSHARQSYMCMERRPRSGCVGPDTANALARH